MAAEPEKRIEESLRAYSRRRREDAGAPMEMHPATRRMLQGEVAKLRATQPEERRSWWQSVFLVWPRFAAAVGMFAVLATGVWVFTQSEGDRVQKAAEMVSTRVPADQPEVDGFAQTKDRSNARKEMEDTAPSSAVAEDAGKKASAKRSPEGFYDESIIQLRDAENAPAPTAARPGTIVQSEIMREKQVAVQYDAPAQQPAKLGALLAQESGDKRTDSNSGSVKANANESKQYYRLADERAVKLEDSLAKERFVINGSGAITTAVTLGLPIESATANYFAYQDTNTLHLFGTVAQQPLNFAVTNAVPGLDVAAFSGGFLMRPSGPNAAVTEWAVDRQVLAENESRRARNIQPVGGADAIIVGQQFERQDAAVMPALLQKFELQQHANGRISIRDADGSVYEGETLAAKNDLDADVKAKLTKDQVSEVNRKIVLSEALAAAASPSIWFRASGTNKNKELVIINGELLADIDQLGRGVAMAGKNVDEPAPALAAPKPAAAPAVPAPPSAASVDSRSELSRRALGQAGTTETRTGARFNERASGVSTSSPAFAPNVIRGRVQIGRTSEVQLRAVRTR